MVTGNLAALRQPILANVKPGDEVVVLSDTAHDARVWQVVLSAVSEAGGEPTLALFEPRPADYYDPPRAVCEAMLRADLNVLVTSTGMLHSGANNAAMAAGVPCVCLDGGMRLEWFTSGAATTDPRELDALQAYVAEHVFGPDARECRVTSAHGTDLTYRVDGRIFAPSGREDGAHPFAVKRFRDLTVLLWPSGEFNVPPLEQGAHGTLVFDLTMHHLGRLAEPIELTIEDSRIVDIRGGTDARILRDHLRAYGDENAYFCPAEASVGINRNALVRGTQREDKNIFGAMHFGLGTNIDVGGTIRSRIHMDGVILAPTLYVDGEMRMREGEFLPAPHALEAAMNGHARAAR